MSMEPGSVSQQAAEPRMDLLDRLTGLFYEPGAVFRALRARPDYILPLILLLVAGALTFLIGMRTDYTALAQPSQAEAIAKIPTAAVAAIGAISAVIGLAIACLLRAAVFFGLSKAAGGEAKFGSALSSQGYVMLPAVLGTMIVAIFVLLGRGAVSPLGLDYYLHLKKASIAAFLTSQISLPVLGYLILSPIAVAETSGISRRRACIIVISAWILVLLIGAGSAAIGFGQAA